MYICIKLCVYNVYVYYFFGNYILRLLQFL